MRIGAAVMIAVIAQIGPVRGENPGMVFDHVMDAESGIMTL